MFFKKLITVFIFFILSINIYSLDFDIQISPTLSIPYGNDEVTINNANVQIYSIGGGVTVNGNIDLFNFLLIGPEFSYTVLPLTNTSIYPNVLAFGLSTSSYFYPTSRLSLQVGGSGGIYSITSGDSSISNLWWKVYGEAGFRMSPLLTLSLMGGYVNLNGESSPIYSGILAGLSAKLSFDSKGSSGSIEGVLKQSEPIFPLFYTAYKDNSLGSILLTNSESAEIRNIIVKFKSENYTASTIICKEMDLIQKGETVEVPLFADFLDTIQNFTENGQISGEVIIEYEILGTTRNVEKTIIMQVYNRNTVKWYDNSALASFISPNSLEVLDFSKYVVGVARNNLKTGLNRNMQFAMYMFQGINVSGITDSNDDVTPYTTFHKNPELLDYIQFPFQTLSYKLGDIDDIGLLFAASMESVGIKTALITLDNDFIVAYSLDITQDEALKLFNGLDNLLVVNNEVWMPLSISVLREGFINSWYTGINKLTKSFNNGENVDFIILQDAWKTYAPSGISGQDSKILKPDESILKSSVDTNLLRYIASEFGPKIKEIQNEIQSNGATASLYNKLGLLYIRAGMYSNAKSEYIKSANLGSVNALINLGNISLLEKDFLSAKEWYGKALLLSPDNNSALNGVSIAEAELQ